MNHPLEIPPSSPVPVGELTWLSWSSHYWLLDDYGLGLGRMIPIDFLLMYIALKWEIGLRQNWGMWVCGKSWFPSFITFLNRTLWERRSFFLGKRKCSWCNSMSLGSSLKGTAWQRWALSLRGRISLIFWEYVEKGRYIKENFLQSTDYTKRYIVNIQSFCTHERMQPGTSKADFEKLSWSFLAFIADIEIFQPLTSSWNVHALASINTERAHNSF